MKFSRIFLIMKTLVLASLFQIAAADAMGQMTDHPPERSFRPPVQKVRAGDIDVSFRAYGTGEPLLLIMGYSGTIDMWDPNVLRELGEKYRVIAFDNRGMGQTTAGSREFTMEQFAEDTAIFMEALKIPRAHVLAWSMGTNIALELVLKWPEKVNRLILYAADPGGKESINPSDEVFRQMADTSGTPRERGQRLLPLLVPMTWLSRHGDYFSNIFSGPMETASPENVARQTVAMEKWGGCFGRLVMIKNPTLLLTGTDDVLTPKENSLKMVNKIPGAWLVQIRGGGHGVMYQNPDHFTQTVLTFLTAP